MAYVFISAFSKVISAVVAPDKVSIDDIVYLDEDLHTYKYFMTGDFDAEARARDIAAI